LFFTAALLFASALPGCAFNRAPAVEGPLMATANARAIGYTPAWSSDLGVPRRDRLTQIEILDDMIVSVETPSNVVSAVALRDGAPLWKSVVGEPGVRLFNPIRSGRYIFVASENRMYTLLADSGQQELWNPLKSPVDVGPALVNTYAIFGGSNGQVFAQDVIAGASRWAYALTSGVVARPVPALPGNVVVADGGGVYAMLDATSGKAIWRGRTFGRISARPAVTGGTVYVASEDQTLYAVLRATGADRWKYRAAAPLTQDPLALGNSV
jgi:outer membrane protein assembly factor BamB